MRIENLQITEPNIYVSSPSQRLALVVYEGIKVFK